MAFGLECNDRDRVNELASLRRNQCGRHNKRYYPIFVNHNSMEVHYLRVPTDESPFHHLFQPLRQNRTSPRNVHFHVYNAADVDEDVDKFVYAVACTRIDAGQELIGPSPQDGVQLPMRLFTSRPYAGVAFGAPLVEPPQPLNRNKFPNP